MNIICMPPAYCLIGRMLYTELRNQIGPSSQVYDFSQINLADLPFVYIIT